MPKKSREGGAFDLGDILGGGGLDLGVGDLGSVIASLPEPEPDPLAEVEYTGDIERDVESEKEALETAFQKRARQERKRFVDATDSEFWFAGCFQSRDQKESFLEQLGVIQHGDKYLDGRVLAKAINRLVEEGRKIELPQADIAYREGKVDPKYERLT